jgi:type I restriction enzyme, S subunit
MRALGDLVERVESSGPSTDPFSYVDLSSVDSKTKSVKEPKRLALIEAPSRARQLVEYGDVLVSTVRPNLNGVAQIGSGLNGAIASTGFCVLRPNKTELDSRYLFNWVRSPRFVSDMSRLATGASYPAVSDQIVKRSFIPLPPLPEQRRIAEILDRTDDLRAKRRRTIQLLDGFNQSALAALIAHDHHSEVELGQVSERITDGTHQSPKWATKGVPFIFVSNLVGGQIDLRTDKFVGADTYAELTRSTPIERGDVLYTAVGSYGVPVVVETDEKFVFQRHIAHIKPRRGELDPYYLQCVLASPGLKHQADRVARGVAQKTVTLGEIAKLRIPMLPIEAQRAFATQAKAVNRHRVRLEDHLATLDELFDSLQTRAFAEGFEGE